MKHLLLSAVLALAAVQAQGAILQVTEDNFNATAGLITFSEFASGTVNPTYTPGIYGSVSGPTVTFGGYFTGQSLSATPAADCPGGAATACIVGSPTASLSLDASSPNTFITSDGANPTSPVLSGSPTFNGPIAILFSTDQYGVGFDGGFFDAVGSTGITAFSRTGSFLGTVTNSVTGIEFLGLVSESADIAGVILDLVGSEPAGFAIDNIRFGQTADINPPISTVPLPAGLPLLLSALGLGALLSRRRKPA